MNFLKNLNVRVKLLILTVPLSIALIVSCIVIASEMKSVEAELTDVFYDTLFKVTDDLINADRDLYQARVAQTAKSTAASDADYQSDQQDYEENMQQTVDRVREAVDIASKNSTLYNAVLPETGDSIAVLSGTFEDHFAKALAAGNNNNDSEFIEEFDMTRSAISDMTDITEQWATDMRAKIEKEITSQIVAISIIFGALVVVLILLAILVIREIRNGISSATDNLNELAKGNLQVELPDESTLGKDELGQMQRAIALLVQKLSDIMSRSNEMAKDLSSAGSDLASSSDQASQASGQVTVAVGEISQGAVSQAQSVEHAAGNTNDIGNDIEVIAGNVDQLDQYATSMKTTCDEAMEALNRLLAQSHDVQDSVRDIDRTIQSTNESANGIHEFVNAITSIASQTNLLSLNASIEAARAGEAGRGFAVVAGEIATLADQSNQSAQEIGRIVEKLISDAAASVDVMAKLNESFESQASQMEATRNNMESMAEGVVNVAQSAQAIAAKVEGLTGAKNTLVGIVSDLSAISEENAASTEQTNASMQELNSTFNLITESANNLQGLAKELQEIISYFG